MTTPTVLVVGAGISGVAAAHALLDRGAEVHIADRGREVGGRMAVRHLSGRVVDIGASYFTSPSGSAFAAVVDDWVDRGLARPWTDTFSVAGPQGLGGSKSGPVRFAASGGLRSLVADLADSAIARGAVLRREHQVTGIERTEDGVAADGVRYDAVVLAMPDPQSRRLVTPPTAEQLFPEDANWEAVLAVAAEWPERWWPQDLHGAFVNDSPELGFIADDGDRRGDGAPVLVLHSTAEFARRHLEDPEAAVLPAVQAAVRALGGRPSRANEMTASFVQRWTYAKPAAPRDERFRAVAGIGVCGDAWGGKSSVGAAWESGTAVGRALPLA